MTQLEQVAEFHQTFNHPIEDQVGHIDPSRALLRLSLLQEELNELQTAIQSKNQVEVLDALCDIEYILKGTVLEFGFQHVFDPAFDDVHASNMTKACVSLDEAKLTQTMYAAKNVPTYIQQHGKYWIVYREEDGKVLKSINYRPVNLMPYFINV